MNKELPADIVFENEDVIGFRDINPQASVHCLFVPRQEIATLNDIREPDRSAVIGKLYHAAVTWAHEQGLDKNGFRTVMNCNAHGCQTVFHIHLHLLAGEQLGGNMAGL
jgi:histidine triad (HIT) family protein